MSKVPEINFYHLEVDEVLKTLVTLASKIYADQHKRVLVFGEKAQLLELDDVLWSFAKTKFFPHALVDDRLPEKQPILLSDQEANTNQAEYLLTTGVHSEAFLGRFARVFYVFLGIDPTALQQAREAWKDYKSRGYVLKYYRKSLNGGWEQVVL